MVFQSLYIIRHGDRYDYSYPIWKETAIRPGDPPLSDLGHQQASETGAYLSSLLMEDDLLDGTDVTFLSSPFLRCIQTSTNILAQFSLNDAHLIKINPEYSVFEIDTGHDAHSWLPSMEERSCYFPRLDASYDSVFVPDLPEKFPESFLPRCEKAMEAINQRFKYAPKTSIIIVTHAAGCIGLAASAAKVTIDEVNAAAPCSIFKLTRTSDDETWKICSSCHGYKDHMTAMGKKTWPWHFSGFITDEKTEK